MYIIWIALLFVTLMTVISEYYNNKVVLISIETTSKVRIPNKILFSIVIFVLVLLSGLRSSIGDTGYYMYSFKSLTIGFFEIFSYRDWGYTFIQFILKKVSSHPQFILIVTSFITISSILITLYKYSRPLSFAVFLFITSGIYISTMNGLRQFLVAAILFSAVSLIFKGKTWKYLGIICLLSTIHNSVLIMIPVYFIVRQKAWSKKIFSLIAISFLLFIGFDSLFGIFSNLLEETQYGNYTNTFGTETFSGANKFRIIVAAVPVILAYLYRNVLNQKLDHYNIYVNFSLLNFIVILFASYNWIFARVGMYFDLYNLILLPAIIKYCFSGKLKILMGYVAISCYIIFFYFEIRPYIYSSYFLNISRDLIGTLTRSMYN